MPKFTAQNAPLLSRLPVRLMLAMGAALLPLALLTYAQTLETEKLAEGRARAAILGDTATAAGPQIATILQAQATAATLAAVMPTLLQDPKTCVRTLATLQKQAGDSFSLIAFTGLNRQISCASSGKTYDMSKADEIEAWLSPDVPQIRVNENGPISHQSILGFSHPVFDPQGVKLGIVTISAPHHTLNAPRVAPSDDMSEVQPLSLVTFDAKGAVLTATSGTDQVQELLPMGQSLASFSATTGQSFVARTEGGERRAFAVVPLLPGALFVMGSWPANRLTVQTRELNVPAFVFPLLMWAASLMVAWLAAEHQVLSHVRSLHKSIVAFARGDRHQRPLGFGGAAAELRDVGLAYERMTDTILRDEAEMEDMLHQKEVLLREVHHRVKNNLQLIASILNMQLRKARSPETKEAMRNVQDRVMSLATVHRELYQTSGLVDVSAHELLPQIVGHILRIGSAPGRGFKIETQISDLRLTPDQAVPLSLFLTEGMSNMMKHAPTSAQGATPVTLRLQTAADGFATLELSNPAPQPQGDAAPELVTSDGFGSQLLMAFASQLEGKLERGVVEGRYRLALRFPIHALSSAEQRSAPPPELEGESD